MSSPDNSPQKVLPSQESFDLEDGATPPNAGKPPLPESGPLTVVAWDAKAAEKFIKTVGPDTGYARKPVEAIMVRPKEGKLTVQSRRWYNVLLRNAQVNPPPMGQRARMSLKRFQQDARQEKVNNEYLTEVLNVLLTTGIEWGDSPKKLEGKRYRWSSATLLSFASIEKDGRDAELVYDFDPEVRAMMLTPEVYAKISLEAVAKMSTHAALFLYELGARYYSPKMELSSKELPWKEWVLPMSGSRERNVEKLEYKTFVRDILKPALLDVNNPNLVSIPFNIRAEERKVGRRVEFLRFVVVPKRAEPMSTLGTSEGLQVEVEHLGLIGRLINLKVPQAEAESLYHRFGHARVRAAIEAVERRRNAEPIDNPVSYVRKVIKSGSADASVIDVEAKAVSAPTPAKSKQEQFNLARLRRRYVDLQREEAKRLFAESTNAMKSGDFERFEAEALDGLGGPLKKAWTDFRRKGPEAPMPKFVQDSFFTWYTKDMPVLDGESLINWGAEQGFIMFENLSS